MDELEIGGKKYISSKRAAREHRYHIDYIGQLIRGGKIIGKKIGRSWYVEDLSLKNYLRMESGLDPLTESEEVVEAVNAEVDVTADESMNETDSSISIAEITMENIVISESETKPKEHVFVEETSEYSQTTEDNLVDEEIKREVTVTPIRIPTKAVEAKKETASYVRDTEPMMPILERKIRENADFMPINLRKPLIAVVEKEETQVAEDKPAPEVTLEEEYTPTTKKRGGSFIKRTVLVLVVLGVLAGAAASTILSTKIDVTDGKAASVRLSLP